MVTMDDLHALAQELIKDGMKVFTLPESFLTLEGTVQAIDQNPPHFGGNEEDTRIFIQAFMNCGYLPLTAKMEDFDVCYVFGIEAHNSRLPGQPLKTAAEIIIQYEEAQKISNFPLNRDSEHIHFVLIPSKSSNDEQDQYNELVNSGTVFSRQKRILFLKGINEDSTATESLFAALKFAISREATDIHIEPDPALGEELAGDDAGNHHKIGGRIRYRIDGQLISKHSLSPTIIKKIVAVIKGMANLELADHRFPQDGRITFGEEEIAKFPILAQYDLRVSILPTIHGEKAELRLLRKQAIAFRLNECGFTPDILGRINRKIAEPRGMFLVTGPTGSGKTTTLYAALRQLNNGRSNITTIEDPVEIVLPGISQTQIDQKINLGFPQILRAALRQDPDIIMIGEIRDEETAVIAARAAITGHLVISTLHVSSSLEAILRLQGLGVPGVYVASSLLAVLAQRLVRRLCPNCFKFYNGRDDLKCLWGQDLFDNDIQLRQAVPDRHCGTCGGLGYAKRMLLAEMYVPGPGEKEMMSLGRVDAAGYYKSAIARGFEPLPYAAMRAIISGQTTIEEVLRSAVTEDEFLRDGPLIAPIIKVHLTKSRP